MSIQKFSWIFAIVFIAVGALGFVPGITTNGHLLSIFEVNTLHNIIHLATGVVAAFMASSANNARLFFKVFGVVYAVVAIVGLVQGTTVLGLIGVNMADNLLHVVIAALALWLGFMSKDNAR
jgi:hypothetical protein